MQSKSYDSLLHRENIHKEKVYCALEEKCASARFEVNCSRRYVDSGAYEDQDAFTAYGDLYSAADRQKAAVQLYHALYRKPYFAHIEVRENCEAAVEHFFLSDCDSLNEPVDICEAGYEGTLFPFKQNGNRPIFAALFHCYQAKNGAEIRYTVKTGQGTSEESIQPVLICDDEIDNRELINAIQFFPETGFARINADEFLERKLSENRDNPSLRNIIATLQQKQFRIIEADPGKSFVVQGCAGSGKSQCLLHRLFYLRDELSQEGWKHVLLLTPTQLFRNYSSELMRRYQLSDIHNCSLAELYQSILLAYDSRFRNRQYQFELTEEYLPDQYLQFVYGTATIQSIDEEIESAAKRYVFSACSALGLDMADEINAESIDHLVKLLDADIAAYDSREAVLSKDAEYEERRAKYEQLQRQSVSQQKVLDRLLKEKAENEANLEKLNQRLAAWQEAKQELSAWIRRRNEKCAAAKKKLAELGKTMDGAFAPHIPAEYAHQLYIVKNLTCGSEYDADEEYLQFLKDVNTDAEKELIDFTKGQKPEQSRSRYQKRQAELVEKIRTTSEALESTARSLNEYADWLEGKARELEGEKARITLQRAEMDRARYFLSRIESTIFEQVVWNALLPYKEKYNVQALDVVAMEDGHQRETRILYKSDLLFYVKVYARIHQNAALPDYRLLCIDEGQDLHKADYDMLHALFPNAIFNVFGDTAQVLHTACGISDWKSESGIPTIYSLNRNYRNTAAIVDFCNARFAANMEAFGKVRQEQYPVCLKDHDALRKAVSKEGVVIIVKDRKCYEQLCIDCGLPDDSFAFLDTKAEKPVEGKIACYSIFAAKGLEFSNTVVYLREMTANQKVVACTRAMEGLYYYE